MRAVAYCGEEQGLFGSRHHAAECRNNDVDVYAMLQGDMIAVKLPDDKLGVALVNRYTDPVLTELVEGFVATYVPELAISSQSACCSGAQRVEDQFQCGADLERERRSPELLRRGLLVGGLCGAARVHWRSQVPPSRYAAKAPSIRLHVLTLQLAGDVVDRDTYSIPQLTLIAQAMVASIAELAEPI